jgi:hypothetical protein
MVGVQRFELPTPQKNKTNQGILPKKKIFGGDI